MTNVLIPTDFTSASFYLAKQTILALKGKKLNITLFHAFEMPDAFDLLDRSRKKPYHNLLNESFRQSCRQLKELYPLTVQKIAFNCMEGNTAAMFRNFAEANEIDLIIYPEEYRFIPANKLSVDPWPLFKKSGVTILREFNKEPKVTHVEKLEFFTPVYAVTN